MMILATEFLALKSRKFEMLDVDGRSGRPGEERNTEAARCPSTRTGREAGASRPLRVEIA
jgi:hypothetical protein